MADASRTEPHEPLDLEPIKVRIAAATPGPMDVLGSMESGFFISGGVIVTCREDETPIAFYHATSNASPDDDEFIAHAWTDVPVLVAEVEWLRERLAQILQTDVRHALHGRSERNAS